MIYLQLFLSFFKIGLFGFGGGYAILSLIQHEIETYGWMTQQEFTDIVAISQMTPGPIGINSATYVGYTASGTVLGSLVATTAIILPSIIIMLIICTIYLRLKNNPWVSTPLRILRYAVIGLIAAAALILMTPDNFIDIWSLLLFLLVFIGSILPTLPIFSNSSSAPSGRSLAHEPLTRSSERSLAHGPLTRSSMRSFVTRALRFLSHPITLIIIAGCLGYLIYGSPISSHIPKPSLAP